MSVRYVMPVFMLLAGLASATGELPAPSGRYEATIEGDSDSSKNKLDVQGDGSHQLPRLQTSDDGVLVNGDFLPPEAYDVEFSNNGKKMTITFNPPYVPGSGSTVHFHGETIGSSHHCDSDPDGNPNTNDGDLSMNWHS